MDGHFLENDVIFWKTQPFSLQWWQFILKWYKFQKMNSHFAIFWKMVLCSQKDDKPLENDSVFQLFSLLRLSTIWYMCNKIFQKFFSGTRNYCLLARRPQMSFGRHFWRRRLQSLFLYEWVFIWTIFAWYLGCMVVMKIWLEDTYPMLFKMFQEGLRKQYQVLITVFLCLA